MYFLESIEALLAFCHNGSKDGDQKLFNNKGVQEEEILLTISSLNSIRLCRGR
jgi:hypothetical protein